MKISFPLFKSLVFLIICGSFQINECSAQKNGILPLTGLRYFNEGIVDADIDVRIDGAQLLSNRIPLNREIELSLKQPAGFIQDNNKTVYAGAEVIVLSPMGVVLSNLPNVLANKQSTGFTAKELSNFSIKFAVLSSLMKNNFNGLIKIRLYDLKSKNQQRFEFPVTFARQGESVQVSRFVKPINSIAGCRGVINGLNAGKMIVNIDTAIKVSPKMAYTSLDIKNITGSSIADIFGGKENFWVYDSDLNEVKISDILLKQVKGALENNDVDYTLKIPYRLKTNKVKLYTVRFRWESPDRKQVIDVVVTI